MGAQATKESATEEGIVYVETEQRDSETASIDQLLIKLQELPQAAPLLKETLTDIHWKDLEALRKIDAEHVFDAKATHKLLGTVKDVYAGAARRVAGEQERVHIKVQQAERVAQELGHQLQGYVDRTHAATKTLVPAAEIVDRLDEMSNRIQRAEAQARALQQLIATGVQSHLEQCKGGEGGVEEGGVQGGGVQEGGQGVQEGVEGGGEKECKGIGEGDAAKGSGGRSTPPKTDTEPVVS